MAQQENSLCKMYAFLQFLALYWKFVPMSVWFSLLHLDFFFFFALQQKCMVPPRAFAVSVDPTSAVCSPMGVCWS